MQASYPVVHYWLCVPLLVLTVSAISQAQVTISFAATDGGGDELRIQRALAERGSLEVVEKPLREVVQELSRQFQVQIVVSQKKLEEASVSPDTPITKKLHSLPLESILRRVLADLELGFVVRDNVLLISTPEDIESQLDTRVYPVLDLVTQLGRGSQGASSNPERDYASLIDTITCTIAPDTWDALGGPGSITAFDNAGVLVVSQTHEIQDQIGQLLQTLRRAKSYQGIPSLPLPASVSRRAALPGSPGSTVLPAWQVPRMHSDR